MSAVQYIRYLERMLKINAELEIEKCCSSDLLQGNQINLKEMNAAEIADSCQIYRCMLCARDLR